MDTVIDKLSEIEAAAQAITDEANARKKAFAPGDGSEDQGV